MENIQLTPHFKLSEFTRSATATARHIDNTPNKEQVKNLQALCLNVLEPLRAYVNETSPHRGDKKGAIPIIISSGYRCPKLNSAVGGVKNSQHQTGEACDIHLPDNATGREWFVWMMDNLQFNELIWEYSIPKPSALDPQPSPHYWIHVSFKRYGRNRQQVIQNLIKHPKA